MKLKRIVMDAANVRTMDIGDGPCKGKLYKGVYYCMMEKECDYKSKETNLSYCNFPNHNDPIKERQTRKNVR